jgi:hypothetical protein
MIKKSSLVLLVAVLICLSARVMAYNAEIEACQSPCLTDTKPVKPAYELYDQFNAKVESLVDQNGNRVQELYDRLGIRVYERKR